MANLIVDKGNDWGLYVFDILLIIIAIIIFTPVYFWEKLFKKENDYYKERWLLEELEEYMITKCMKKKYPIANGGCAARFQCSNINKKCCKPEPEKGKRFVYCEFKENENKH